jgi:hypothetical protein
MTDDGTTVMGMPLLAAGEEGSPPDDLAAHRPDGGLGGSHGEAQHG